MYFRHTTSCLGLLVSVCVPCAMAQEDGAAGFDRLSLERVLVTGLKPVAAEAEPGGQILVDKQSSRFPSIGEWLKHRAAGVTFSEPQGNPFQPELSYRGYGVSGLLGLPQGLAFFQNGVRVNEAFGDIVNFDMLPEVAVDRLTIVSGANPLFGYNALGGAIASTMKTGFTHGNTAGLEISGGSFGRLNVAGEAGYSEGLWGIYTAIEHSRENGWRDFSPSEVLRIYGDVERRFENGRLGLSITWANSDLNGNGAAPEELLEADRSAVFTHPDNTRNDTVFAQTRGDWLVADNMELSGEVHYRRYRQNTLNGDETDAETCPDGGAANPDFTTGHVCFAEETELTSLPTPNPDDGAFYALNDEDEVAAYELAYDTEGNTIAVPANIDEEYGVFNRSSTLAHSGGFSSQFSWQPEWAYIQETTLGLVYEHSAVDFATSAELGALTDTRSVEGSGVQLGTETGEVDPYNIGLKTRNHTWSAYSGVAFNLYDGLMLEFSFNVNGASIILEDQNITDPLITLNGQHDYVAFNPALELSYAVPDTGFGEIEVFARYAESNRVPSPAELACADPDNPCRFPNAFIADPPLEQVKVRSGEIGIGGSHTIGGGSIFEGALNWSLAGYYSRNLQDIIFISAGETVGSGFFDNVGETQRAGFESLLRYEHEYLTLAASYSYIDASFLTAFDVFAENHPAANSQTEITASPGDRIPLVPAHSGYISAELHMPVPLEVMEQISVELGLYMVSERYLRGDESNQLAPLPGFARLDLNLDAILVKNISLFLSLENLSFSQYATFGTLGEAGELALSELGADEDDQTDYGSRFVTPAAPFSAYGGIRIRF